MKVLLVAPFGGVPGGISRWTGHLMKYYHQLGNQDCIIEVVSTSRSTFININTNPLYRFWAGMKDYRKIFRDLKRKICIDSYDLMHLTSSGSWSLLKDLVFLKLARKNGLKTIIHFRFGRIPELFVKKNLEYKLLVQVLNIVDKVIVLDKKTFDSLVAHEYLNVELLPNPLAPEVEDCVNKNLETHSRDSRTILFIGHIVPTKGVFELVGACRDIQDIKLKMVGTIMVGVDNELLELAKKDGDNTWLELCGERPYTEVLKEMLKCTIFVLPTYTEGFPNVILESMACGCPIIASDVGAIPEMLNKGGDKECGIIVSPKDVGELREAINNLLRDPERRDQLGAKAQKRAHQMYSMQAVWKELVGIWKSI